MDSSEEAKILEDFPSLSQHQWELTSPAELSYNCIGWALEDKFTWWPDGGSHWPHGVPREETVAGITAMFGFFGYVPCESPELEPGFQKVAIYAVGDEPTHAARQLEDGTWASKLGVYRGDIQHRTLAALEGEAAYGWVALVMKRAHGDRR